MLKRNSLSAGDPAPHFSQRTPGNPQFAFDTAAGRYLVLCFLGSASDNQARKVLSTVFARSDIFDDRRASFFGVTSDVADETSRWVQNRTPGYRFFWDFDLKLARLYGAAPIDTDPTSRPVALKRFWLVLDPTMRVIANIPFSIDASDITICLTLLSGLDPPERFTGIELQAPVLFLPRVFEPELCRHLIDLYETNGGVESGVMREVDGRTIGVNDPCHKRRKDYNINDADLIASLQRRIQRRVVPEIAKAYQFYVTRMERYIVACYDVANGGHFAAHRDNTTKGTAHRRFAVSINLNDDFDGGEVSFPEYGPRGFKAPAGGAVVFSCSLLHKVSRVTRGKRFTFLPFLYDDVAAKIREANATLVGKIGSTYRAE